MDTFKKSKSTALSKPQKRGRGKRAGLDLAQIVAAARGLAPAEVTMKAVADELGVDRKALNYYVADRECLLKLVASEVFDGRIAAVSIAPESSWQEACRSYGWGLAESIIEMGVLTEHLRLSDSLTKGFISSADAVLDKLIAAGLSDEIAARALSMLCNISSGYAKDTVAAVLADEYPLALRLQQVVNEEKNQSLKHIERITSSAVRTYNREQLEFNIDIFIAGVEALLPRKK